MIVDDSTKKKQVSLVKGSSFPGVNLVVEMVHSCSIRAQPRTATHGQPKCLMWTQWSPRWTCLDMPFEKSRSSDEKPQENHGKVRRFHDRLWTVHPPRTRITLFISLVMAWKPCCWTASNCCELLGQRIRRTGSLAGRTKPSDPVGHRFHCCGIASLHLHPVFPRTKAVKAVDLYPPWSNSFLVAKKNKSRNSFWKLTD